MLYKLQRSLLYRTTPALLYNPDRISTAELNALVPAGAASIFSIPLSRLKQERASDFG